MPASTDRWYLPVSLNGRGYQIDVSQYKRATLGVRRGGQDPSREPSEQSLTLEGQWRRNASDWALGAGQQVWDEQLLFGGPTDRNSNRSRFRTSRGIDVWTKGQFSLLHETESIKTMSATAQKMILAGSYLYVIDGNQLRYTANPTAAVPAWSAVALPNATGSDLTSDGSSVFIAFYDTITPMYSTVIGSGVVAPFGAWSAGILQYANGRLFTATGTVIREMDGAGAVGPAGSLMFYSRSHGSNWVSFRSAPNGVYAYTSDEVYVITENDQTGALNVPILAMSMPNGEFIRDMIYYGSLMVIATSRGIRLAQVSTNGALIYGLLLPINDDRTLPSTGVEHLAASGEYVWFDWAGMDATTSGLGRADIGHWTEPMVPAYASDVEVTVSSGPTTSASAIVAIDGKPYFMLSEATVKVYRPSANLVASGSLSSGHIRFGTFEPKVLHSVDIRHEALNGEVEIHVITDDGTDYDIGESDVPGSLKPATTLIVNPGNQPRCEDAEVELVLTRSSSDHTKGPVILRWTFKATVQPYRQEQFVVPLVFAELDRNSEGEGTVIPFDDLRAEYALLKNLESNGIVFDYMEGNETHSVTIDGIEMDADNWDDNFAFFRGIIKVTLLSQGPAL